MIQARQTNNQYPGPFYHRLAIYGTICSRYGRASVTRLKVCWMKRMTISAAVNYTAQSEWERVARCLDRFASAHLTSPRPPDHLENTK